MKKASASGFRAGGLKLIHFVRKLLPGSFRGPLSRMRSLCISEKRMVKQYWDLKSFLKDAQWWERHRIEKWQLGRLKEMIRYAYDNVPGYYALYHDAGVTPEDIVSLEDVRLLPFTTKELIRDNLMDFTSRCVPVVKLIRSTTGGSTGTPFCFYRTPENAWQEKAFMHSGWEWVGWKQGGVSAFLRGGFSGSQKQIARYDRSKRELHLSSYYLTESNYQQYIRVLKQHSPKYLLAYPSACVQLAELILKHADMGTLDFDAIFLGSENVYDWQKAKVKQAFPKTKLFGWYGQSEQVILAPMCEHSDCYHPWPFYGLTEVLDPQDNPVGRAGFGELVGTSFWCKGVPFIRYRTADMVRRGGKACDKCNRQFDIIEYVEGRKQDFVVTADGGYVTLTALIFAQHFNAFGSIEKIQLYQDKVGEVVVRVVPAPGFSERDGIEIKDKMEAAVGGRLKVTVVKVDEIPRTKQGKYKFLEQKLNIRFGN